MVSSIQTLPADADLETWLQRHARRWTEEEQETIRRAHAMVCENLPEELQHRLLDLADILAQLNLDYEVICAALLQGIAEHRHVAPLAFADYGTGVTELLDGVAKLKMIGELHQQGAQEHTQLEQLRKMLLAMARDVRVVVIALAIRLSTMRHLDEVPPSEQKRFARETLDLFSPLANRLGIGQFKWELEDLSLRYLEPLVYKNLARALDERRQDRERYIHRVMDQLARHLRRAGIRAEISGRAKHIYSIWKKMQRKQLPFDQIFDVRAVRLMVHNIRDCYAALGVIHSLWSPLHEEFDDYIANPKENGYQSLHTAVSGPEGKTLEIQIRTKEMHRSAELGVAAHWRYKEGGKAADRAFEQQIAWLRQMLEWNDEDGDSSDFLDRFKAELFQDRVFAITPKGNIIDLEQGATPLDFAYRVHTEVGHRCRGAKVNGRIVQLNYELRNGDRVEVLTAKNSSPSRDWLNPHLGYLKSTRARNKVRQWFKLLDLEKNIAAGRSTLEQELKRLGIELKSEDLQKILTRMNLVKSDDLYAALGQGTLTVAQILGRIQEIVLPKPQPQDSVPIKRKSRSEEGGEVKIRGVGSLLTTMSRCCKPVPFDAIVGFITRGRGVSIHRKDCPNLLNLADSHRERLIEVDWGEEASTRYEVDIHIDAYDRPGLLRDITSIFSNERSNVLAANTLTDKKTGMARMVLTLEIADLEQLSRIFSKISQLPNVVDVTRKG